MFTNSVLLYPDTGRHTMAALKTAALYADRVHSLALVEQDVANSPLVASFLGGLTPELREKFGLDRIASYFDFINENIDDLLLLRAQGILRPLEWSNFNSMQAIEHRVGAQLLSRTERLLAEGASAESPWLPPIVAGLLDAAYEEVAGGYSDMSAFFRYAAALDSQASADAQLIDLLAEIRGPSTKSDLHSLGAQRLPSYLLLVAVVAEENGIIPLSTSAAAQRALFALRALIFSDLVLGSRPLDTRKLVSSKVEHEVISAALPSVHRLGVEAILELRERRAPELERMRNATDRLAAEIDVSDTDPDLLDLLVHDAVARDVQGALDDLRRALLTSRIDGVKNALGSVAGAASAVVPATLAVAAGASVPAGVITGALGAVANIAGSIFLDNKRIRGASNWGFVIDLQKEVTRRSRP